MFDPSSYFREDKTPRLLILNKRIRSMTEQSRQRFVTDWMKNDNGKFLTDILAMAVPRMSCDYLNKLLEHSSSYCYDTQFVVEDNSGMGGASDDFLRSMTDFLEVKSLANLKTSSSFHFLFGAAKTFNQRRGHVLELPFEYYGDKHSNAKCKDLNHHTFTKLELGFAEMAPDLLGLPFSWFCCLKDLSLTTLSPVQTVPWDSMPFLEKLSICGVCSADDTQVRELGQSLRGLQKELKSFVWNNHHFDYENTTDCSRIFDGLNGRFSSLTVEGVLKIQERDVNKLMHGGLKSLHLRSADHIEILNRVEMQTKISLGGVKSVEMDFFGCGWDYFFEVFATEQIESLSLVVDHIWDEFPQQLSYTDKVPFFSRDNLKCLKRLKVECSCDLDLTIFCQLLHCFMITLREEYFGGLVIKFVVHLRYDRWLNTFVYKKRTKALGKIDERLDGFARGKKMETNKVGQLKIENLCLEEMQKIYLHVKYLGIEQGKQGAKKGQVEISFAV